MFVIEKNSLVVLNHVFTLPVYLSVILSLAEVSAIMILEYRCAVSSFSCFFFKNLKFFGYKNSV